jgi:hypothetical protein
MWSSRTRAGTRHRFLMLPLDGQSVQCRGVTSSKTFTVQVVPEHQILIASGSCASDSLRYRAQSLLVSFSSHVSAAGSEVKKRVGTG